MRRTSIYIDGSNFYFSIKKTFGCKIDIEKFCKKLVGDNNSEFVYHAIGREENIERFASSLDDN